jgi:secreted PhoX family phosphatase
MSQRPESAAKTSALTETSEEAALKTAESRHGGGQYFGDLMRQRLARRTFIKSAGLGAGVVAAPAIFAPGTPEAAQDAGKRLTFTPILGTDADAVVVPTKYTHNVVIRWGDPLFPGGPAFDVNSQTAAKQDVQFGFNCDFVAQYPLPSWFTLLGRLVPDFSRWLLGVQFEKLRTSASGEALLWSNHEYTTGKDMFPGYTSENPTKEQVDMELAAHGGSLVVIRERGSKWEYARNAWLNRRITGETAIRLSGPVAGHDLVKTSADPSGRTVKGMLNNCGGGITPWGTVLTAEENFDQYFGGYTALKAADPVKGALYARLAPGGGETERKWERHYPRFSVAQEPNEYARFGWVVEVDPYDPTAQPRKRTALGRFKHEAAANTLAPDARLVVYSGDDARFEYAYKFVSAGQFNAFDRDSNLNLLDSGTLYVAKFNADGSGNWLPLVWGEGPLTAANGFPDQATVLINARGAADKLGATKMDRPEDIEISPVTQKVYIALTNNSARTTVASDYGEVAVNPRLGNRWGHIVELTESGGDNSALSFQWEIFMLCGDPAVAEQGSYFAGYDPSKVSPIASPDNLDFDQAGNLWIATDGQAAAPGFATRNDGIFAVPTEGPDRGYLRQFLSSPKGSEVAGLKLSTDDRTIFATIQHPGEGAGLPNSQSSWPDGTNLPPRPAVVAARHVRGLKIGR